MGTVNVALFDMKAEFTITWATQLDRGTGDYYPYMYIGDFEINYDHDVDVVVVYGPSTDD